MHSSGLWSNPLRDLTISGSVRLAFEPKSSLPLLVFFEFMVVGLPVGFPDIPTFVRSDSVGRLRSSGSPAPEAGPKPDRHDWNLSDFTPLVKRSKGSE